MKRIGILDPEGLELNPLTEQPYSPSYKYLVQMTKWNKLPMYTQIKPESIIKDIITHQVIILESGTGSGKSVLMPKYALHALDYKGKVVITNPKQLPTRENAEFAASLLDVELGKEVGFQHKDSMLEDGSKSKTKETKLLFSTDGSVVEVLRNNPDGRDYDIVIIDEAHERNMRIDLLLLQMKKALRVNPKLKLIVMSATLPGNLFYDYFKEFVIKQINVSGKENKPVKDHYLVRPVNIKDINQISVDVLFEDIIDKRKQGDVLIFTTSLKNGEEICTKITKRLNKSKIEKAKCYLLGRGITDERLRKLAIKKDLYKEEPGGPWDRKIVIGTPQVESSITVDGIIFVIDNGYAIEKKFDFSRAEDQIVVDRISKSSAMQRRGRAGRTQPGECFKLYTQKEEEEMSRDPVLDVKKEDLTAEIFDVFNQKDINTIENAKNLFQEYIEPPPEKSVKYSLKLLYDLRLLDSMKEEGKVTGYGKIVLKMNKIAGSNIKNACALVASAHHECLYDMCNIVSIMNNTKDMNDVFVKYNNFFHDKDDYEKKKKFFTDDLGDIFTIRKMFNYYLKEYGNILQKEGRQSELRDFCDENYLNYNTLSRIHKDFIAMYRRSRSYLANIEKSDKNHPLYTKIILSLLTGYVSNIAKKEEKQYINWYPQTKTSAVTSQFTTVSKKFNYIMYMSLDNIMGKRNFNICIGLKKEHIYLTSKQLSLEISFPQKIKDKKLNKKKKKKKAKKMKNRKNNRLRKINTGSSRTPRSRRR